MESENYKNIKKDTPLEIQVKVLEDITVKQQAYIDKLEKELSIQNVSNSFCNCGSPNYGYGFAKCYDCGKIKNI